MAKDRNYNYIVSSEDNDVDLRTNKRKIGDVPPSILLHINWKYAKIVILPTSRARLTALGVNHSDQNGRTGDQIYSKTVPCWRS